jgi:hypothetical protein
MAGCPSGPGYGYSHAAHSTTMHSHRVLYLGGLSSVRYLLLPISVIPAARDSAAVILPGGPLDPSPLALAVPRAAGRQLTPAVILLLDSTPPRLCPLVLVRRRLPGMANLPLMPPRTLPHDRHPPISHVLLRH